MEEGTGRDMGGQDREGPAGRGEVGGVGQDRSWRTGPEMSAGGADTLWSESTYRRPGSGWAALGVLACCLCNNPLVRVETWPWQWVQTHRPGASPQPDTDPEQGAEPGTDSRKS